MGIYLGSSPISVYMSGQDAGPKRQEKTVTAGTSAVTVTPDSGSLLSKVVVNPTPSQVKNVVPGAVNKTVSPDEGKLLSSVTVEGDVDLVPDNIKNGVDIFGVVGTMETQGLYVWKKKALVNNTISNPTIVVDGYVKEMKITSTSVNLSLVDESFFDGFVYPDLPTTYFFEYVDGILYHETKGLRYACTYDPETTTLYAPSAINEGAHSDVTFIYNGDKTVLVPSDENIIYVVSDDQNAYPDGGVKDGYYYERNKNLIGIDYGEITLTTQAQTITVSHNLGVIPSEIILYTLSPMNSGICSIQYPLFINTNNGIGKTVLISYGSSSSVETVDLWDTKGFPNVTSTQIEFKYLDGPLGDYLFSPNIPYNWVAIA